jgi:hypothetical protein
MSSLDVKSFPQVLPKFAVCSSMGMAGGRRGECWERRGEVRDYYFLNQAATAAAVALKYIGLPGGGWREGGRGGGGPKCSLIGSRIEL